MEAHVKVLAWLHITCGLLGLLGSLLTLMVFGGAAGAAGLAAQSDPDAWVAVPIIGVLGLAIFGVVLLFSIPGLVSGVGLLKRRRWARILALIYSVINLVNVPIGTALGVYGLWVLASSETGRIFDPPAESPGIVDEPTP